jgi:hypothetical protein
MPMRVKAMKKRASFLFDMRVTKPFKILISDGIPSEYGRF